MFLKCGCAPGQEAPHKYQLCKEEAWLQLPGACLPPGAPMATAGRPGSQQH